MTCVEWQLMTYASARQEERRHQVAREPRERLPEVGVGSMRPIRVFLVAAALAVSSLGVGASGVFAYGKADQPLAQLELSANCVNRTSPLCAPDALGLGGIWVWVEVDADGTADVAGSGCEHLPGAFGGAESIRGEFPWTSFTGTMAELQAAYPDAFAVGTDPNGEYYVLPDLGFAFPMTTGHYTLTLDKGVFLQAQVAP
jgi:hypothetical protein